MWHGLFDSTAIGKKAEITVDSDLGGVNVDYYEDYIDIITDTLEFEDNYGDPAVFVYDEDFNSVTGKFETGKTYNFSVYLGLCICLFAELPL